MLRRAGIAVTAALVLTALAAGPGGAQDFPTRPVRLIVPLAAGGGTDILARLVAQKLQETWSQPVIVENRVGGFGVVASEHVAKQPADGYTVLISVTATHALSQHLSKLNYDPIKDFAGVTVMAYTPFVWLVGVSQPFATFRDLIDRSKAQPVLFGSPGSGSLQHIYGEMLNLELGARLEHVPYRGVAPAIQDVVAGHIPAALGEAGTSKPLLESGKVRGLAITGAERSPALPSVPTFREAGIEGFEHGGWFGVWVPAGTPKPVVDKISQEITRIVRSREVSTRIRENGWEVGGGSPEEFTHFWHTTAERLGRVVKQRQIKAE
jgi:tripartite-type tricarboxylate transporter receptor subunit TctC